MYRTNEKREKGERKMIITKKAKKFIRRILKILGQPEMLILPGQLAFFLLLAIVPTFTIIAYVASFFNVSIDFASSLILKMFGSDIGGLLIPFVRDIHFDGKLIIPLLVAFYAASGGASSIIVTSNQLYHLDNTPFLKRKIKGIIMIMILVSLVTFLLLIPVLGGRVVELIRYVNMNETVTKSIESVIHFLEGPISWIIIFIMIKIIYTMAPDETIPSSNNNIGTLFTTIGLSLVTFIYSLYATKVAHYDILYGGLSHFVVLMIWLYLLAYIIIIGIAINAEEYEIRKKLAEKEEEKLP